MEKERFGSEKRQKAREGLYLNLEERAFDTIRGIEDGDFNKFLLNIGEYYILKKLIPPNESSGKIIEYDMRIKEALTKRAGSFTDYI